MNIKSNILVGGQDYGLIKTAMKVYNSTNFINRTKVDILSVIEYFSTPQVITTSSNPFSISLAIEVISQIIEE